jgi:quercetin dioxygenase-like cupin family protein
MHSVAAYPTPVADLQLDRIDALQSRYPEVTIGFSTHEAPDTLDAVKMAVAKGARIFEKHVAVAADGHTPNAYSATPAQVKAWLDAASDAFSAVGMHSARTPAREAERKALRDLRRGVFVKRPIAKGERVSADDMFFAIPTIEGQVTANDCSKYTDFIAKEDIEVDAPVMFDAVHSVDQRERVYQIVQRVRALLTESGVRVPGEADLEISHHYGLDRFDEVGTTLITVVNREYCKKLILMLPGQEHPEQYHQRKEETFHILHGSVRIALDGKERDYSPGDVIVVERGVRHRFGSTGGAVMEEISSSHYKDDSYYTDPAIGENLNRKTSLTHWMG